MIQAIAVGEQHANVDGLLELVEEAKKIAAGEVEWYPLPSRVETRPGRVRGKERYPAEE